MCVFAGFGGVAILVAIEALPQIVPLFYGEVIRWYLNVEEQDALVDQIGSLIGVATLYLEYGGAWDFCYILNFGLVS